MIGSSSYVTSVKKGRAIGGCCSSSGTGGGVTSLNSLIGPITIVGTGDTTVTTFGSTITVNSSGGGGGSFLPLAGGTMTGISGAPISNVESINGPPIGDLLFKTVSGNINIDTSGSGIVQIGSPVIIQPPTGYTYPESISSGQVNIGTQIKDWVNTTTDPSGTVNEAGLFINNIASANGVTYGMVMDGITSTTQIAYGILCVNISGATSANGALYSNITSLGNSTGLEISSVTGDSGAAGGIYSNITSVSGGANGININSVTGYDAYGIQSGNVSGGNAATGLNVYSVQSGSADSIGVNIGTITTNGSASVYGLYMTNMNALGGGTANALFIENVSGGAVIGERISIVTASTTTAIGVEISDITGITHTAGIKLNNVTSSTAIADGLVVDNINGASDATGFRGSNVSGATAYGININNINSTTSGAYGAYINNINSTTSGAYGVYIGPNLAGPVGSNFGFYQEGILTGTKIVNNMMNELRCGTAEDPVTGTSFKINGNAFYSAQYPQPDEAIVENGGNLVLLKDAGVNYKIFLPSNSVQEGHQYTICMRNTADVQFTNGGSDILVNGDVDWICPAIPAGPPYNYRMLQAFYTSIDNLSGEWYIG
jgi:hypothetical protein